MRVFAYLQVLQPEWTFGLLARVLFGRSGTASSKTILGEREDHFKEKIQ